MDPYTQCTVTLRFGVFPNSANGQAILSYTANGVQQPDIDSTDLGDLPPLTDSGGGSCPISYPSESCVDAAALTGGRLTDSTSSRLRPSQIRSVRASAV